MRKPPLFARPLAPVIVPTLVVACAAGWVGCGRGTAADPQARAYDAYRARTEAYLAVVEDESVGGDAAAAAGERWRASLSPAERAYPSAVVAARAGGHRSVVDGMDRYADVPGRSTFAIADAARAAADALAARRAAVTEARRLLATREQGSSADHPYRKDG